ncbi:MAG: MBL fold metallo-hydrolase, partial [Pseudorhodoplanes sp.]
MQDTAMRRESPHRRSVLAGLGAALAAPALPGTSALAAIPPFRGRLGSFEVSVISDGTLSAPLSFMLPDTPPAEAAKLFT